MSMLKTITEFPAYKVIERPSYLKDGDIIAVPYASLRRSNEISYRMYTMGSVAGMAIRDGECPFASVEDTKQKMIDKPHQGHKLHWANQNSVTISSHKEAQKTYYHANIGDVVRFHGKDFKIAAANNQNVNLVEVEAS